MNQDDRIECTRRGKIQKDPNWVLNASLGRLSDFSMLT